MVIMNLFLRSLLTLTLCVAVVRAEGPTSNRTTPLDPSQVKLVAEACKNATDVNFCVSTLNTDPASITANPTGLTVIALRVAATSGVNAWNHIETLLKQKRFKPEKAECLSECSSKYISAVMYLDGSLATLSNKYYYDLKRLIGIALLYQDHCRIWLTRFGPTKETVMAENNEFKKLIDTALTLVNFLQLSHQ